MTARIIPFVCFLAVLRSTPSLGQQAQEAAKRSALEDDIREAVLQRLMQDWAHGGDKNEADAKDRIEKGVAKELNFKIFFVSVNHKDPTDDFLNRFQNIPRTLKKVSAAKISKGFRMPVVDRKTQQHGIIFSADSIRWLEETHVEVQGGYHCNGLCGAGYTFDLELENGKWIIKKEIMNWIS